MFQLQKSRKFSNIGIVLLIALTAFFAFGQTQQNKDTRLEPNRTVERELAGGQSHTYRISLQANEFLQIQVEQKGVDVVVKLFNAGKKQLAEKDNPNGNEGLEELLFNVEKTGEYEIQISAFKKNPTKGNYSVQWTSRFVPEQGRKRIQAKSLYDEAKNNTGRNETEETLRLSITKLEEAKKLYRELNDKESEANCLILLGRNSGNLIQYEKAAKYYEQALLIHQESKDREGEVMILDILGNIYSYHLSEYEKAKNNYEQLLAIVRKDNDQQNVANTLNSLGYVYENLNQYVKALYYYQQSLEIFQKIEGIYNEEIIDTLLSIRDLYVQLNQEEKAQEAIEQALTVSRKAKDKTLESEILSDLGSYYTSVDSNKAIQYWEQFLVISQELKDTEGEFYALYGLGKSYRLLKKYEKALKYYEQAFSVAQKLKDDGSTMAALYEFGELYLNLKNYEKARNYLEQALAISQKSTISSSNVLVTQSNIASIYLLLKQYDKAIELYETDFNRNAKEFAEVRLSAIAYIYRFQKKYDKAKEYYEKQLTFYKENNISGRDHSVLLSLGELYQEQRQYDKALNYFLKAQTFPSVSKSFITQIRELFIFGKLYLELKQYEKARGYFEQVFAKVREGNLEKRVSPEMLSAMVNLWVGLKNPELAIFYGKQEVNKYQAIRTEIKTFDKDTQFSFVKDKEPAYRKLADLLISEGRLPEAQTVLDLLKEEEYRNFTVRRSGEIPDTVPYSKAESDVAAKVENLAKSERELADLLKLKEQGALTTDKQSRLDQIPTEIEAANRAFRLALDALAKSESSVESKVAEIKSEQNLQRALAQLQKDTNSSVVALYTVLGTEDVSGGENTDGARAKTKFGWIILVTPNLRKAYPIDVAELEQIVFQFRETLQSDKYDPQPLAEKLYQKLFRQTSVKQKTTLEADLETLLGNNKDKTLMWSLDSILRYVPMAALHDGKGYLVEKYRNVVFTKESFLTLTGKDSNKWQALGLGVSEGGQNYSPLPGAEKELRDIVREPKAATGILDGVIRLNKDFTEEATVRLWREGKYPVIHIASHYAFNPTDPTSSFLLLGDGQLTFSEMQDKDNLFGTVDLLTLSACDTAMTGNGKEAEGFAYLAQSLGAKSVIASLWKVSDAGTPELMIRFYKLRAENPQMAKGEAFRLAQISLLGAATKNPKTSETIRSNAIDLKREKSELRLFIKDEQKPLAHPHYWSSFVLIGNWR